MGVGGEQGLGQEGSSRHKSCPLPEPPGSDRHPGRPPTCNSAGTLPACPNPTYAVGAGFILILFEYFARCTEPVAFFATGGHACWWIL